MIEFDQLRARIKTLTDEIGVKRDELRRIHSELTDILESVDSGTESIEDALRQMERGIDEVSQYV